MRCGYSKCSRALSFHHRDPSTKKFGIGTAKTLSIETLRVEAAKCDLLCANCHMEVEEEKDSARSTIG